jgi:hypothetical protein
VRFWPYEKVRKKSPSNQKTHSTPSTKGRRKSSDYRLQIKGQTNLALKTPVAQKARCKGQTSVRVMQ